MVSTSGNIRTKGTVQSGQNFGDYAEYFESQSGQPIPTGTIVTLDGRYVEKHKQMIFHLVLFPVQRALY